VFKCYLLCILVSYNDCFYSYSLCYVCIKFVALSKIKYDRWIPSLSIFTVTKLIKRKRKESEKGKQKVVLNKIVLWTPFVWRPEKKKLKTKKGINLRRQKSFTLLSASLSLFDRQVLLGTLIFPCFVIFYLYLVLKTNGIVVYIIC